MAVIDFPARDAEQASAVSSWEAGPRGDEKPYSRTQLQGNIPHNAIEAYTGEHCPLQDLWARASLEENALHCRRKCYAGQREQACCMEAGFERTPLTQAQDDYSDRGAFSGRCT